MRRKNNNYNKVKETDSIRNESIVGSSNLEKEYSLSSLQVKIIKFILLFSWPIFGLLMTITDNKKYILLNSIVMFIFLLFFLRKQKIKSINRTTLFFSFIIACYSDGLFMSLFSNRVNTFSDFLIAKTGIESIRFFFYTFISFAIFPTIMFCIYWFINRVVPFIRKEVNTLSENEKKFLFVVLLLSIILSVGTAMITSAFQIPSRGDDVFLREVIFTGDNGKTCKYDGWMNLEYVENDIRQPLFAVFSLPMAIFGHIISELLFFLPSDLSYYTVMSIIQFLLLAFSTIFIVRLLNIEESDKKYFYLLVSLSFPYVLFGLVLEQYVISLFYLVLTIYFYFQNKEKINYLYLGAVGTMITSGVLFPFITKFKDFKDWFKKGFKCFCAFIMIMVLSGQFSQILTLSETIKMLRQFTGVEVGFIARLYQFTHFIEDIFLSPNSAISKRFFDVGTYQLVEAKSLSIIGICILFIVFISFFLNRKEKMAQVSFFWILFSIFVLVLVGWGSIENGQILYSLYFAWAYYILYFMFINKIKNRKIFKMVITISIIIMFIFMFMEMINILKYAITYFPR